ncbi:coiled-coil domain-containing protein [Nonomuraea sp. NPDC050536]|uniref:coiled-coil domain-containing protein n=1 Tax=Nonomuraea sp. NPDC050536 TaxID=3364366 RepID=UPI0037CA8879
MADRSVSVALRAKVSDYVAGMGQAKRSTEGLSRQLLETGGSADEMRRRLEAASKRLPKIKIDADSSAADIRMAQLRKELESLSSKRIGIDISAEEALARTAEVAKALEELGHMEADPLVRADVKLAMAELKAIDAELSKIDGQTAKAKVDVDTKSALPKLADFGATAGESFAESLSKTAGPAMLTGLAAAAVAIGPAIGSVTAASMVTSIGAGLTTLGVQSLFFVEKVDKSWSKAHQKRVEEANREAEKLKEQFRVLGVDLMREMAQSSRPLLSVLDQVRSTARDVGKDVAPNLERGFSLARVPLEQFVRDLGRGLKDLGDSIPSLMGGFSDIVGQIDIKGFLKELGSAFSELGRTISENRTAIGAVLNGLLAAIPLAINGLSKVVAFFGTMVTATLRAGATIAAGMSGVTNAITGIGIRVLEVVRNIGQAMQNVPGAEELGKRIVAGANAGIDKLTELKNKADETSRSLKLKADIADIQQKLDKAMTLLDDPNLTKERRSQITSEITKLLQAKGEALRQLGDPALIKEYRSSITTDIAALQSRLADAKKELKDPDLTKERKSRLNAEISQLKAQVELAKAALASVKDKTVTLTIEQRITQNNRTSEQRNRAAGAIDRYAAGGITAYAAGGLRPQPPALVSKPTVLYGEGSSGTGATEAFIPYEQQFRPRAIQLLGQVAADFGLEVYSPQAALKVDKVTSVLDQTRYGVASGLTSATSALTQTLGQSGSLTQVVANVGDVGKAMTAGWVEGSNELGQTVTSMSDTVSTSIDDLSGSVSDLANAVVAANSATSGSGRGSQGEQAVPSPRSSSTKSKGKAGSTSSSKGTGRASQGERAVPPPPKAAIEKPIVVSADRVGSLYGSDGSYVTASAPQTGGLVNSSRVSAPVMGGSSYPGMSGGSPGGGSGGGGAAAPTVINKSVNFNGTTVRETADAQVMFAQAGMFLNSRG